MKFFFKIQSKFSVQSTTTNIFSMTITTKLFTNQSEVSDFPGMCSFSWSFHIFHLNTNKLGVYAPQKVWIGDFNVKAWKTTEFILHKTWRSLKFCKLSAKRAHPCWGNNRSTLRSFTDYNPCYPEPCGNGKCTDVGDTYTCSCDDKYMGTNCSGNLVSVCMSICQQSFLSVHVFVRIYITSILLLTFWPFYLIFL